jgi:hypothetical protein
MIEKINLKHNKEEYFQCINDYSSNVIHRGIIINVYR